MLHKRIKQKPGLSLLIGTLSIALALHYYPATDPEIALIIGEHWEDMRQRSSASIDPVTAGTMWFKVPDSDAQLRLADPDFAFTTPPARFFTISYENNGSISMVRMSPQIEPLLIDETFQILLDLQRQWKARGWKPIWEGEFPPFADTPAWREELRERGGRNYWEAKGKYEIMIYAHQFQDSRHPQEERYLITLELTAPIRALIDEL